MASDVEHADEITLLEGEKVIHSKNPSFSRWGGLIIFGLLTSLMGVGLIPLLYVFLKRRSTRYIVTNQRVIEKTGILGTAMNEYRISDIRQLQTGAGWLESLVGKGNLSFSAGGANLITFAGVPDYDSVANTIRERQRELESE